MKVTIVIPAYNEAKRLSACLEALAIQQTQHEIEVVLVDNASTDETLEVAQKWKRRLSLRILHEPVRGRGSARRRGFAAVTTAIVLSTDADSEVPKDWVEKLVDVLLSDSKAVAVSGSSYITDGTPLTNWTMKVGMPLSLRLYRLLIEHYMLTGANFAIRRSVYEKAGGFDAAQDMLDDVDLSFRVARLGNIRYHAHIKEKTEGDIFGRGYIKGFCHYVRHLPVLLKKYKSR